LSLASYPDCRATPLGFGLNAAVLDYPGGMPGDIGFFLT
jgi:hypothetical protein